MQQTSQKEWERQAVQSLQRARARRKAQDVERNDRFWFWGLVAIAAIVVTIMVGAFGAKAAGASPGCHTNACRDRVWNRQHPFRPALASWYDLGGGRACGFNAWNGVANKSMACGTKLRICFHGCTDAVVNDRGPYSGAREFDLGPGVRDAIGFDGVATVRVRVLR